MTEDYNLFASLLRKCGYISWGVDQHYISLYIPHHLMFHFATLSNFLLDRNSFSLMYCLYIRKCQNLQECEGLQGDLRAPRGGQKIPADVTRASANRSAASIGGVGLQTREGTKKKTDPWVRDNKVALQNRADPTQIGSGSVHCDSYLASPSVRCHPQATRGAGARTSRAQVLWAVRCGE